MKELVHSIRSTLYVKEMKLLMDMYKCVTVDCEVKSKIVSCAVGDSEGLPFNREM